MARKNLLKGLIDGTTAAKPPTAKQTPRVDSARPRYTTGAIGAVNQSIVALKSRSVADIDPRMVDIAGMRDRLDGAEDDLHMLTQSIRDYGQQVPVLLRPNPNDAERYQVVYGRRRVAALKSLGLPVKALVRVLDDRALVIAQGQENAARKDLSFVEKANFARQMRDAGYDRKIICDALHMDKTLISRMLSVTDRIPLDLIEAIGAAPLVGRDRWLKLADKIKGRDAVSAAKGASSEIRFNAVMASLATPRPPALPTRSHKSEAGVELAKSACKGGKTVLTLNSKAAPGFDDWLVHNLARLHRDWLDTRDD